MLLASYDQTGTKLNREERKKKGKKERKKGYSLLFSLLFALKPSQPQRVISGLRYAYLQNIHLYIIHIVNLLMICISYMQDFIYAQKLTHSYTLNVVYLHDNAQKGLYKNSCILSDT